MSTTDTTAAIKEIGKVYMDFESLLVLVSKATSMHAEWLAQQDISDTKALAMLDDAMDELGNEAGWFRAASKGQA